MAPPHDQFGVPAFDAAYPANPSAAPAIAAAAPATATATWAIGRQLLLTQLAALLMKDHH
ncbi:hypothetical protein [Amycolatopsis sp. cmx-4-83]|uniref:hypothetical protein n=1 Tax=Amycolatopsis sp. cmx-4-83 TaxID=2790940 RepID=UPI00397ABF42